MSIEAGFMVPHPPLIIPDVGKGEERGIQRTIDAYKEIAGKIAHIAPELIIVTSPHATMYGDYFHISPGTKAHGSFANFRAPQVRIDVEYDVPFRNALRTNIEKSDVRAGTDGERDPALDHGTMIPLYFINEFYTDYRIIRIGLSGMPLMENYKLGRLIAKTVEETGRKAVFVASGDLSHKLLAEGPYGFSSDGPKYDERIMKDMGNGDFKNLLSYDDRFLRSAAECGHGSFTIMAGAFDGIDVDAKILSHEGPFGVGYGICSFYPKGKATGRDFLDIYEEATRKEREKLMTKEDEYIKLARNSLETFVTTHGHMPLPHSLPENMYQERAGAFVSLHINGQLRGCIGTIAPVQENLAMEIIENAVSAGTKDPRFPPVKESELPFIEISVDVLSPAEDIASMDELDVKEYGVIVTKGYKRGLLLPNLDGVDTIEEQVAIAKKKAGIPESDNDVKLQRFRVVRHEAG